MPLDRLARPGRDGKVDTGIDLVARTRDTGEYTAIQCKFYEPTTTFAKSDIASFFTGSGKKPFTNRIIISTTDSPAPPTSPPRCDITPETPYAHSNCSSSSEFAGPWHPPPRR